MNLDLEIFEMIAAEKSCDVAFPLKEKMLIEIIKQFISRFETNDGKLIFGGGTSLVCAYDELTQRFSEDADFRFVPCPKSTKNVRRELTEIANTLDGFKLIGEPISDSRKIEFRFVDIDNIIQHHSSLRPYIKLEVFFTDNLFYEAKLRALTSCYNKKAALPSEVSVLCVSLQDTAIDKISSFLWRIYSSKTERPQYTPSDMRHLHDLAFLSQKFSIDDKFRNSFFSVFNSDIERRLKDSIPYKQLAKIVLSELETNKKYKSDYNQYVSNMSYAKTSERFSYDDVCASFEILLNNIKPLN